MILQPIFYVIFSLYVVILQFDVSLAQEQSKQTESIVKYIDGPAKEGDALIQNDEGMLLVKVNFNGREVLALLDTGATNSVVDLALATEMGLKTLFLVDFPFFEGREIKLYATELKSLSFNTFYVTGGSIAAADFTSIPAIANRKISMFIGADILAGTAFEVDWDKGRVRLLRSGAGTFGGARIPLHIARYADFVIKARINGRIIKNIWVDTGAGTTTIRKSALARLGLSGKPMTSIVNGTIAGRQTVDHLVADNFRFGATRIDKLPLDVAASVGTGEEPTPYPILLGMDVLRRFNFRMDVNAGYLVLAPRKTSFAPPPKTSTSGILGIYTDDGLNIEHIMRGSPAEKIGFRAGDRICTVDGVSVDASWAEKKELRGWSTAAPGKKTSLQLCDGSIKELVSEEFY